MASECTSPAPTKRRRVAGSPAISEVTAAAARLAVVARPSAAAAGRRFHTEAKVINDPIHSSIELHPCLLTVIDTPQFQRLRSLKQLGAASWVYPAAMHSRFEHSIGVSHLATKLLKSIKEKQPELNITDMDILCVGLAGLCHDLGHGPFSHLFDGEFLRGRDWAHEEGSVLMLRYLLEDNGIDLNVLYGLSRRDLIFVEELILGKMVDGGTAGRKGRPREKAFLYDIINNERSGFDVDKLDYILRDSYYTGVEVSTGTNVDRIAQMARVLADENGTLTISFPEKSVFALFGVFHARVWLHSIVYQHKVVKACEYMIRDALLAANDVLKFRSKLTGKLMSMYESVEDMSVFAQLKDSVLDLIELSQDPAIKPAQDLLARLHRRDLYRCCGSVELPQKIPWKEKAAKERSIAAELLQVALAEGQSLEADDFIVEIMLVHHGKGTNNPMDGLRFYAKRTGRFLNDPAGLLAAGDAEMLEIDNPPLSQQSYSSTMTASGGGTRCFKISQDKYGGAILPSRMGVNGVRVFAKQSEKRDTIAMAFREWTRKQLQASPLCHNTQQSDDEADCDAQLGSDEDRFDNGADGDLTVAQVSPSDLQAAEGPQPKFVNNNVVQTAAGRRTARLAYLQELDEDED